MVGTSINGYQLTAEELLASMSSNGVDKSVIVPVQPKTYRLEPQNEAVAVTQLRYPDRFIGFCRIDPRQGEDAIAELRRCGYCCGRLSLGVSCFADPFCRGAGRRDHYHHEPRWPDQH